ncbi:DNA ligase, ATP-dependent, central [Kalmanozyma brasiliensis GHG001]|uniref:DNA ligase n=1 Tax=Kalmanozyma brasiliensis (strain GHG001) TaxID=1365824 RepID=V5E638_KALBG|nr:DNA ligase, ATP-dependent, central [Kalmanozyma brasiliensis GHG001]EST05701.1 DNA ligase, ATP-dependent, central [Kalmanozyma brasiliensis GHG001]
MTEQPKLAKYFGGGSNGANGAAAEGSSRSRQQDIKSAFAPKTPKPALKESSTNATTAAPPLSQEDAGPVAASSSKRDASASNGNGSAAAPERKKRRIIESDDEDDDEPVLTAAPVKREPAPAAASTSKVASIFAKPTPKTSVTANKGIISSSKSKADATESDSDSASEHVPDNVEDEDEHEEEAIEEEEQKGAKKLAAIFQKPSSVNEGKVAWKEGEPVPYAALASAFADIQATTKRLEITEILTQFLVRVIRRSPDNLLQVVYLCINRLCPDYEGLELGIGESLLVKAIAQSTGREVARIKKDLEAQGDLGLVALNSKKNQPTMFKVSSLKVPSVFKQLKEIAAVSGNKSQDRKIGMIKKLLASCQGEEPKFLIRSLEGKLRIGLAERSVLVSLARAVVISKLGKFISKLSQEALAKKLEEGTELVKAVYSELPSYDLVIPALLRDGVEGLREACKLTPGVPLKPMLAKPTKAISEVLDRFEGKPFTCEYKYDGERAQVHLLPDGKLAVFSRNSENMSVKYPDLVEQIPRCINSTVKSFVLDAEAAAWKAAETLPDGTVEPAKLLPFQELSRRKRKDVKASDITVKVKLFGFDLLYLNGEPLLSLSLAERRTLLREHFHPVEDEFDYARSEDCNSVEEISVFLDKSVKEGTEGLMVKMLSGPDSTYEPSRRSMNWLKLKKDYLAGTGDSLDLVVIGGYYGKGKRTNVYGAFLLACYDADSETYQTICKIGTGFTEVDLESHYKTLKELEISGKKGYYDVGEAKPDVYFEARVVWEVLTADLSLSPVYTAAKGLIEARGISLRFPRFIRIRDDKTAEESTSPEQIEAMYRSQVVNSSKGKGGGEEDDGFW